MPPFSPAPSGGGRTLGRARLAGGASSLVRRPAARASAATGGRTLRREIRQQRWLRSDHLLQRIARAHFFAIGCVALCRRNSANADRANQLAAYYDRQPAFLCRQSVSGHILVGKGILHIAVGQRM